MNPTGANILSFILAISVHGAVIGILLVDWGPNKKIETTKVEPYYIESTTVKRNPHRVSKEREQQTLREQREKQQRIDAREKAEKLALVNRQRLEAEKVKRDAERKAWEDAEAATEKTAKELLVQQQEKSAEAEIRETERQEMEQLLNLAVANEQVGIRAVTDDEKAMAYVSQIQREIIQNWSRPPSARNGMQALLKVFLVPTGEVVSVMVESTSGNDAFDRSAVLAVRKAEQFVVPTDLRQFERNFREFEVLFRPEDLRL
ncbi:MAG: cell envelope integrity protein TolA [bacterium]|nr:TonB family protein [Gammaproteobacteria bacterium]